MTCVTCKLTAKDWDQLRNPMLGNRVWATFTLLYVMARGMHMWSFMNMINNSCVVAMRPYITYLRPLCFLNNIYCPQIEQWYCNKIKSSGSTVLCKQCLWRTRRYTSHWISMCQYQWFSRKLPASWFWMRLMMGKHDVIHKTRSI